MLGGEVAEFVDAALTATGDHEHRQVELADVALFGDRFDDQDPAGRAGCFDAAGQDRAGMFVVPVVRAASVAVRPSSTTWPRMSGLAVRIAASSVPLPPPTSARRGKRSHSTPATICGIYS